MFTGLIEDIGTLRRRTPTGSDVTLEIATGLPMAEVVLGESIAVNGVCLTVTSMRPDAFTADASVETLKHSSLNDLKVGDKVHLERALQVGGRLGGHFVQGHVDGVATLVRRTPVGRAWDLWLRLPDSLLRELVPKGSIAVDGVSLTVNELTDDGCRLTIVPHTEDETLLLKRPIGATMNIETDMIGKYVRRFVEGQAAAAPGASISSLLAQYGFTSNTEN